MPLRKATIGDLGAILKIENDSFASDIFNKRQFRYLMTRAKAVFRVLVTESETVVGYSILLAPSRCEHTRAYSIAISDIEREKGYGKILLQQMEKDSVDLSFAKIRLEVRSDNSAAITLYEKSGYRKIGEKAGYYEDGQDALVYQKLLGDHEL
jgi:[ribosomal protein S18]-alanine N-acetyltransferase